MKTFRVQYNIGKAKYVVSYYDGAKKHPDGSPFFDITIFKNKIKLNKFTKNLIEKGYIEK